MEIIWKSFRIAKIHLEFVTPGIDWCSDFNNTWLLYKIGFVTKLLYDGVSSPHNFLMILSFWFRLCCMRNYAGVTYAELQIEIQIKLVYCPWVTGFLTYCDKTMIHPTTFRNRRIYIIAVNWSLNILLNDVRCNLIFGKVHVEIMHVEIMHVESWTTLRLNNEYINLKFSW